MVELNDTRELGKMLAFTTEHVIAPQWLRTIGIDNSPAPDDEDGQQPKFDILTSKGLRVQVKFRGGKSLHMEQTRRTTGKNAGAGAKNGQVRYSLDSFDVVLFVIPNGYESIDNWQFIAIPASELEDDKMPGYCVGRVPVSVKNRFIGKAQSVLTRLNER